MAATAYSYSHIWVKFGVCQRGKTRCTEQFISCRNFGEQCVSLTHTVSRDNFADACWENAITLMIFFEIHESDSSILFFGSPSRDACVAQLQGWTRATLALHWATCVLRSLLKTMVIGWEVKRARDDRERAGANEQERIWCMYIYQLWISLWMMWCHALRHIFHLFNIRRIIYVYRKSLTP